jgi:hypothetical protein
VSSFLGESLAHITANAGYTKLQTIEQHPITWDWYVGVDCLVAVQHAEQQLSLIYIVCSIGPLFKHFQTLLGMNR